MGLIIECPYYVADKKRTISCEGRLRYFQDTEQKKSHLAKVCEKNYANCKYYKDLQVVYECGECSALETKLALKDLYLSEERKTIKRLIQRIGIMEKAIAHNMEVKQEEINKLRGVLKISMTREQIALTELAAMMHLHGIETVDFKAVEDFRNTYSAWFEELDGDERTAKLVVKAKGQE